MAQRLGATFGIAIITATFSDSGSLAGPAAVAEGFRSSISVSAALSAAGALTALGIRSAAGAGQRIRRSM